MREILDEHTKKRNRLIKNVQKSIGELQKMDYKIKVDTTGLTINHVYLYDTIGTGSNMRIIL